VRRGPFCLSHRLVLIVLAPTFQPVPLWDIMVEYRLYLPMFSIRLLLACVSPASIGSSGRRYSIKTGRRAVLERWFLISASMRFSPCRGTRWFRTGEVWEDAKAKSAFIRQGHNTWGPCCRIAIALEEAKEVLQEALNKNPRGPSRGPTTAWAGSTAKMGDCKQPFPILREISQANAGDIHALCRGGSGYLQMDG